MMIDKDAPYCLFIENQYRGEYWTFEKAKEAFNKVKEGFPDAQSICITTFDGRGTSLCYGE